MSELAPDISIITSVLNGAGLIERLLDSLAAQSARDFEHIVMDGGSTDGTVEILSARSTGIRHWESSPDRGIYHAWNRALQHASGRWCCFLGADDYLWDSEVVARLLPRLRQTGQQDRFAVVYGRTNLVDESGTVRQTLGEPWPATRRKMRENMALPNPSTFYRRDLFATLGGFNEEYSIAGDYEFALRVLASRQDAEALFLDDLIVAGMQAGGLSVGRKTAVETTRQVLHARRRHGASRTPVWCHPRLIRVRLHTLLARLLGEDAARRVANRYRAISGRPPLP